MSKHQTDNWLIKLLSSVLYAIGVMTLGITKMLLILMRSYIIMTFRTMVKKKKYAKIASKQKVLYKLSKYDKVGFC